MHIRVLASLQRLVRWPPSPQRFFLLLAGPIGLLLVFLVPPFQAPDEHTHFYKEVALSRGHIMAEVLPYRVGSYLPEKYTQTTAYYQTLYLDSEKKLDPNVFKRDLTQPALSNKPVTTPYENTAQYPPLAYAPQAMAIFIAHLFTGSVLLQMYAARLATLICWLLLVFLAIRILPFAKWGAVALVLTPLSLFLSASSSNDAITFGLSLLTIAAILAATVNKGRIHRVEATMLIMLGAALGFSKPPYFLLTALALAIPVRRFGSWKRYLQFMAAFFGITLFVAVAWNLSARHLIINFYPGSTTAGQTAYVLNHFFETMFMIINSFLIYPIGDDMFLQIVGLKAWMVARTPYWMIGLIYTVIILSILYKPDNQKFTIPRLSRWLSILITAGGVLAISLLLYLTYTPLGLNTINGLQGRYFIPFLYLAIPALGGMKTSGLVLAKPQFRLLLIVIAALAVSTVPLTISRYYAL